MSKIVFVSEDDVPFPQLLMMFDTSWFKVLTFLGFWSIIWFPVAFGISKAMNLQADRPLIPKQKIILLASLYLLSPIVLAWKIRLENFSLADLGLVLQSELFVSTLSGIIIGLLSLIIVFALESIFNLVVWHWENTKELLSLILPVFLLSLFVSLIEELVFRGYIFTTLAKDYSYWIAAMMSSLIFALLHLIWERKETLPQIPGLWLMGIILVGARIVDNNSLGLAIGLHASWIWGLTCIDSAGLLTYNKPNSWLTGLNQQPLAGVAGISCLVITGLVLWSVSGSNLLVY